MVPTNRLHPHQVVEPENLEDLVVVLHEEEMDNQTPLQSLIYHPCLENDSGLFLLLVIA